jgi:hypothetical protein
MSTISRHSNTCKVTQVSSKRIVEAEVQDFTEHDKLNVVINKSVKLSMKWNGRTYEGKGAGMDFESSGPSITKTQTSSRG